MPATQVASKNFILERCDGTRTPVTLMLGVPYEVDASEARCSVRLDGVHSREVEIAGCGTLHALCLATRFAWQRLDAQLLDGHRLLEAEGGTAYDRDGLATLFGMKTH